MSARMAAHELAAPLPAHRGGPKPYDGPLFPLEPLLQLGVATSASHLARRLRLNGASARKVREQGLTLWQADRAAVMGGLHPVLIWPDWLGAAG